VRANDAGWKNAGFTQKPTVRDRGRDICEAATNEGASSVGEVIATGARKDQGADFDRGPSLPGTGKFRTFLSGPVPSSAGIQIRSV